MTTFEFDGEKYKKASTHQKEWGQKLIDSLEFIGGEKILDLGCGDGVITAKLAEKVPNGSVLGIDASEGMITTSRKLHNKKLKFLMMDINRIDFEEEFDIIFSNATLHWIIDHKQLLQNCYKALVPSGRIRLNFAGDGNCSNFYSVIKKIILSSDYDSFFKDFSWPWYMPPVDDYQNLLKGSKFQQVQVWEENADRYFPDEDAMIKWIDQPAIVPFIRYIPEEKKNVFRQNVILEMVTLTKQNNGTCFETFRRINVSAQK